MNNESLSGLNKKFSYNELAELEKKLYSYLKENNLYPEDGTFNNASNSLVDLELVLVINGDWKHDHLYCEQLVENFCDENNLIIVKHTNNEIGNSESDSYKSEHKWFLCVKTENIDKDTVNGFKRLFGESLQSELGNDYLDIELEDDETSHGGISFIGETVCDFLSECDVQINSLEELNKLLKENGIKPIEKKKEIAKYSHSAEEVMAARIAKYIFDMYPANNDPQETGYFDTALDYVYQLIDNKPINSKENNADDSSIETEEQLRDALKSYSMSILIRLIEKIEKSTHFSFNEYDTWMPFKSVNEDTIKIKDGKWANKGKEGTHGTFRTKKQADAQRKAMFAQGFHEDLNDEIITDDTDKYTFEMWETDEDNLEDINLLATIDVPVSEVANDIGLPKTQKWAPMWAFKASKIAQEKFANPDKKFYSVKIIHDPLKEKNMSQFLGKKLLPKK